MTVPNMQSGKLWVLQDFVVLTTSTFSRKDGDVVLEKVEMLRKIMFLSI